MATRVNARMISRAVRRYLASGELDCVPPPDWPGDDIMERLRHYEATLRNALLAEVRRRARGGKAPALPAGLDTVAFTRSRVAPMVEGLFPAKERAAVLALLERSVVFLTPGNIDQVLAEASCLETAWTLANIYLGSLGRRGLDGARACPLGMSEATTCYVSLKYFTATRRLDDYLVHEAAHVFHNWKRERAGLPHTRRRQRLLEVDLARHETFAHACEAFSRVQALARNRAERQELAEEYAAGPLPSKDMVDRAELLGMLREAAGARNGWKRILARCAIADRPRTMKEYLAWSASHGTASVARGARRDGGAACPHAY